MTTTTAKRCPRCGARLQKRSSRRGPFLGCQSYPRCRYTEDLSGNGHERKSTPAARERKHLPWSDLQEAVFDAVVEGTGNVFVDAVAGAAKTTSIIEAMWRYRERHPHANVVFLAFNSSIASELAAKVPEGVQAATLHSMGLRQIRLYEPKVQIEKDKVATLLDDLVPENSRPNAGGVRSIVRKLVGLAKGYLASTPEELQAIADHHDIENVDAEIIDLTLRVLAQSKTTKAVDFDDMIWLTAILDLETEQFDLVLVDEAQDLNSAQIDLVRRLAGKRGRIIAVGDPRQAIYGFRGADCRAVERFIEELGCRVLPLSVTYRCPRFVVEIAKRIVPAIEAAPGAPEGIVKPGLSEDDCHAQAETGDLVLCRVNAPLVRRCLAFLREGRKATIQGRDLAQGLVSLVKKLKAKTLPDLQTKLDEYREKESARLLAKKNADSLIATLNDKIETIEAFCEGAASVQEVLDRMTRVFSDDQGDGIKLSSVHRAKGLEASRVWILEPAKMPHPMTKQPWERVQEMNILYVAVTRAKRELLICGDLTV